MCLNCMSNAEAAMVAATAVGYVVKGPVHRVLAAAGLAPEPDPVAHDVRTVAFLRSLALDPVEVLGAEAVAAAEAWQPQDRRRARWAASARPMGSQSLITAT